MLACKQYDINLLDTNIPDNPEPIWDVNTTYNTGDRVQYNNYIYESLIDNNIGEQPDSSVNWYKVAPVNKWALFDGFIDTKTTYNGDIYYKVGVSDCDVIAFFGLKAKSVRVVIKDSNNNIIYDTTQSTLIYNIQDWWEWTYVPPTYKEAIAFTNLPMGYNNTLEFTIEQTDDGSAEVGNVVYGQSFSLGVTLFSPKVSRRLSVRKERDADGHLRVTTGVIYRRITVPVMLYNSSIDTVLNNLEKINGIPSLFIGDEREGGYESLLVYGIYKDFDIAIDPVLSKYELEIEGVG